MAFRKILFLTLRSNLKAFLYGKIINMTTMPAIDPKMKIILSLLTRKFLIFSHMPKRVKRKGKKLKQITDSFIAPPFFHYIWNRTVIVSARTISSLVFSSPFPCHYIHFNPCFIIFPDIWHHYHISVPQLLFPSPEPNIPEPNIKSLFCSILGKHQFSSPHHPNFI